MRSLIDFPAPRHAPKEVIQRLREIDELAELVYFGAGRWVLGRVVPNRDRYARGAELLRGELRMPRPDPTNLKVARLAMQGFGEIAQYEIQGEPDARIVEDLRIRDYLYRLDRDAAFEARRQESLFDTGGDRAAADMQARIDERGREAERWAFRKPVSVLNPGLN